MSIAELQQEINKKSYKFWHLDIFDDESKIEEILDEVLMALRIGEAGRVELAVEQVRRDQRSEEHAI